MTDLLWTPDKTRIQSTKLWHYSSIVSQKFGKDLTDYDALWDWSVKNKAEFWNALWDFSEVKGVKGSTILADEGDIKNATFFPEASLNYAENLLKIKGSSEAIVFHSENNKRFAWTWDELHSLVSCLQQALVAQGVTKGDRVAGFVPNSPYAIAGMLAATSLGAVWSSCSPDFGFNGVSDRFGQIEPKVLFCSDSYIYNGKTFDCQDTAEKLANAIPSVTQVVVFPYYIDSEVSVTDNKTTCSIADFIAPYDSKDVEFTRLPFGAPLFVLFSSGTTGLPKCIVHSVGGTLLQHLKELQLQSDIQEGDRFFYFTTCGWMMWNWLVSGLATGATLILFDGSPFYPDGNRLSKIVGVEKVTHFGTSAKYIDACSKGGITPKENVDLSSLKAIFSTGSPLAPESFDYIYSAWKEDVCLSSIAGGTDICGCFFGGSPISPVYKGQCQKRFLAMDVQVFDENGKPEADGPGELVCVGPHPSQPVGFWNDKSGERYHEAYFSKFENVWHHGDFVEITAEGGAIFYGRSDAVLNPGGVRIGTAEIYRQVERIEEVLEAIVIGQNWDNDVRVVLFVRLRDGIDLDETLIKRIKTEVRTNATPRHVPAKIVAVEDIPRTKSGKITELAVRDIVHGRVVKNTDALANPEALEFFKEIAELQI